MKYIQTKEVKPCIDCGELVYLGTNENLCSDCRRKRYSKGEKIAWCMRIINSASDKEFQFIINYLKKFEKEEINQ